MRDFILPWVYKLGPILFHPEPSLLLGKDDKYSLTRNPKHTWHLTEKGFSSTMGTPEELNLDLSSIDSPQGQILLCIEPKAPYLTFQLFDDKAQALIELEEVLAKQPEHPLSRLQAKLRSGKKSPSNDHFQRMQQFTRDMGLI